jgi:hypothetical protein
VYEIPPLCVASERASERKSVVGIVLFSSFSSHVLSVVFPCIAPSSHSRSHSAFNIPVRSTFCVSISPLYFTSLRFISFRFTSL